MVGMGIYHIALLYIIFRYMHCFFDTVRVKKGVEPASYVLYLAVVWLSGTLPVPILVRFIISTIFLYLLAQVYHGKQGKKLLAAVLG